MEVYIFWMNVLFNLVLILLIIDTRRIANKLRDAEKQMLASKEAYDNLIRCIANKAAKKFREGAEQQLNERLLNEQKQRKNTSGPAS